ncbi:erythroid differentiation-related factor 1-like isoform X2 [Rhopilema esculentum]|uniref:erythroid differentiation-related factor 1-like isoform X2 n=1 Tax=Rhopilema esculentum TaxID=499914 RepID=UPI0031CEA5B2
MDISMKLNVSEGCLSEQSDVSSTAVIKFKEPALPVPFRKLDEDTNLNFPPKNWLRSNLSQKFFEGGMDKRRPINLSSFKMANKYLEHVGNVDVISDAENIKRLLKSPYSDGGLSMAVHRIQNTLLISELDIPKIISAASSKPDLCRRLDWLKRFYCNVVGVPQDSEFPKKKRNREYARAQNMLSKFLHYSIENTASSSEDMQADQLSFLQQISDELDTDAFEVMCKEETFLSPFFDGRRSELESVSPFQRDVVWSLDDITMLVGSDMPIFGGGLFPAVSLKLRDATKPINILTGLDYWLDNLICNVPELAMCYHTEGIVQKYEMVLTEDLPKLEDCKFSPKVVKSIAQDILSFLKSKCTKEGHTYWLFKGSESDIVKLYDLTSICNEEADDSSLNPFTLPVASLLFRIANNMIASGINRKKDAVAASCLLQNCILLLENSNQSELTLAAHYLLAQLYMQDFFSADDDSNDGKPSFEEEGFDDNFANEAEGFTRASDDEKVNEGYRVLVDARKQNYQANAWLNATKEEKCRMTIKFIVKALQSYNVVSSRAGKRLTYGDFEGATSSSSASNEQSGSIISLRDTQTGHTVEDRIYSNYGLHDMQNPENGRIIRNLNIAAVNAYSSLAELSISKEKYGRALRFLKIALQAIGKIPSPQPDTVLRKHAKVNMLLGDVCLVFARTKTVSREDYFSLSEDDTEFIRLCDSYDAACMPENELARGSNIDEIFMLSSEELLIKAVSWYEESVAVSPSDETDLENVEQVSAVTGRLGNVRNELGVFYMNVASSLLKSHGDPTAEEQSLWKKSYQYFETGIEAFLVVSDKSNVALLHSNRARLMRLCATAYGNSTRQNEEEERGEFTHQERLYFNKAFEFYQKALSCLGSKDKSQDIWNQISFDLSGAYFAMACLLQDYAPLNTVSFEEVSKEVQNLMMKSLHYCQDEECDAKSPRTKSIRLRIGTIHHRIASLYHHALRNKDQTASAKKLKSLADLHYEKAYCHLTDEQGLLEYLSTLTEHIALHSQLESKASSSFTNVKRLKAALTIVLKKSNIDVLRKGACILESEEMGENCECAYVGHAEEKLIEGKKGISSTSEKINSKIFLPGFNFSLETLYRTLFLLNTQLRDILKDLVLLFSAKGSKLKSFENLDLAEVKKIYEIYLRRSPSVDEKDNDTGKKSVHMLKCIADIVEKIRSESNL